MAFSTTTTRCPSIGIPCKCYFGRGLGLLFFEDGGMTAKSQLEATFSITFTFSSDSFLNINRSPSDKHVLTGAGGGCSKYRGLVVSIRSLQQKRSVRQFCWWCIHLPVGPILLSKKLELNPKRTGQLGAVSPGNLQSSYFIYLIPHVASQKWTPEADCRK